ncbi:MAG: DUF2304 domain-containing protein [Acidimicrobiia bacterium]|nr:DUF2304 domain-containing protein [Acidimicrobiia bacterium]
MTGRAQVLVVVIAVLGLVAILWLVRRRTLKERFALLWIGIGIGMVGVVAVRPWLDSLSDALGIRSGTSTLFTLAILFLLGLVLYLSIVVSALEEKIRDLAEAVALVNREFEERSESGSTIEPGDHG